MAVDEQVDVRVLQRGATDVGDRDGPRVGATALLEGEVDKANAYLGWNYSLSGKVVEGAKRGRILGFRTANLQLSNPDKLIPATGVYAVHCSLNGEKLSGVMNIGYRPTFEDDKLLVIEVHLLNFDRDIYGENLSVDFITRIRAEKKFAAKDELINQIEEDKLKAAKLLKIEITN